MSERFVTPDGRNGTPLRVLSCGRSRYDLAWLDVFCLTVGVFGLAVVGAYAVIAQIVEWLT